MRPKSLRLRHSNKKKELFVQKRSFAFLLFLLVSSLAMLVSYTVFDNQRVQLDRVEVSIPTMPRSLNGFAILPIADLHGRTFEEGQAGIIRAIGAAHYDVILFLGDMVDNDTKDPEPFYQLIDALSSSGKPMYYTQGNHDSALWEFIDGHCVPTPFLQGLLDRNVQLLDRPIRLKHTSGGSVWLWPADRMLADAETAIATAQANIELARMRGVPAGDAEAEYNEMLLEQYLAVLQAHEDIQPEDIHIAASHYPITPARYEILSQYTGEELTLKDAELMIGGHYHGGQFRFPPFGAIYVHDDDLPRNGWFPDQQRIVGLFKTGEMYQYVSRGLGASGPKPLRFRLFNTPEISLLRLTSSVE